MVGTTNPRLAALAAAKIADQFVSLLEPLELLRERQRGEPTALLALVTVPSVLPHLLVASHPGAPNESPSDARCPPDHWACPPGVSGAQDHRIRQTRVRRPVPHRDALRPETPHQSRAAPRQTSQLPCPGAPGCTARTR